MIKTKGQLRTLGEMFFCFSAAIVIAVTALNIGLKTSPGKILPEGISMRSGEMSMNIIRGIDLALEEADMIRSGSAAPGLFKMLPLEHFDLFFFLALIVPATASRSLLLTGYYIRFGLCCASMYYFLSKHLRLSRLFSALLAVMYTFSSQVIFTAQFASAMNMSVMIPVLMSAFDSYLKKRTWGAFVLVSLASFGLAVSGGFGLITGIPLMILIGLLMCICLYSRFRMAFTSWLKILGGMLAGLALSMVFVLPGLLSMKFDLNIPESFKNSRVDYTLFEMIRGTFPLRSGSIYQNTAPLFYVGILTVVALIMFALNEMIPVRIKVASAVIAVVIHITCCSSFVNETVSVFGTAPVLNSTRLICLEALIFFAGGIGLKNMKWLKRGDYIAACLIPLFFLIMSGNSVTGTSFASPILIAAFLAIIGESVIVYAASKNSFSARAKCFILAAGFTLTGVNAAFIMFNNTMQKKASEEYFKTDINTSEDLIVDKELDLPLLSDSEHYLLVPSDLSSYIYGDSAIDGLNYISEIECDGKILEEIFLQPSERPDLRQEGRNSFLLNGGYNEFGFSPFVMVPGERLFIFCRSSNGAIVDIASSEGKTGKAFTGPFLTEIDSFPGEITLKIGIESESEGECRISFFKLNESSLGKVLSLSGPANSSGFKVDNDVGGICTLVLPYAYDDTKITVNGKARESFDFCGRLAVTFERSAGEITEVTVGQRTSGINPGALISIPALLFLIAIPAIQLYNKNKKVNGEGTDVNA